MMPKILWNSKKSLAYAQLFATLTGLLILGIRGLIERD
jgi:hypothetical protein